MHFQVVEITLDVALAPIALYLLIFTVYSLTLLIRLSVQANLPE